MQLDRVSIIRLQNSVYACVEQLVFCEGKAILELRSKEVQAVAKTCIGMTAEPLHKNVDSRRDGNLSGLRSCDAVSLGEWFSKCRRYVVPSSSRITAADFRTKVMFLIYTPGDSVK